MPNEIEEYIVKQLDNMVPDLTSPKGKFIPVWIQPPWVHPKTEEVTPGQPWTLRTAIIYALCLPITGDDNNPTQDKQCYGLAERIQMSDADIVLTGIDIGLVREKMDTTQGVISIMIKGFIEKKLRLSMLPAPPEPVDPVPTAKDKPVARKKLKKGK